MSALVEVLHFADAACPWDYSAEPVRVALEERYGAQLRWRTVQVGLHESGAAMASRGFTTERLREAYRDFQRLGKRGRVLRLDVGGEGALWCAGAPATELRCAPASSVLEPVARDLAA